MEERIHRKLSPSEIVYDFEHWQKGHILSSALIFTSRRDLISSSDTTQTMFNKCLRIWCNLNPFLRAQITINHEQQTSTAKRFSLDRTFVLVPLEELDVMKNVEIIVGGINTSWKSIYEREFNRAPPLNYTQSDQDSRLLWRLILTKVEKDKYAMILTIHHGITDGRNIFELLSQLIQIIEKSGDIKAFTNQVSNEIPLPLEHYLGLDQYKYELLPLKNDIKTPKFDDSFSKIPLNFSPNNSENSELVTRFESFNTDESLVKKILEKCKLNKTKLTGFLNLIYIISTYEAYKKFASLKENCFYYHEMVSLRPYLGRNNSEMGFYASHLESVFEFNPALDMSSFNPSEFWRLSKSESDRLHEQLDRNEHVEIVKQDVFLVKEIESTKYANGGGVHFALSNLGPLTPKPLESIEIQEFYYQVSLDAYRWSSLLFNGISTLNGKLMWGITYNSRFVRTEIILFIIECIQNLIKRITD